VQQGTIRRVNAWKNSKGFFFLLNEVEGEWFAYGMPSFKVGDHVQFEPQNRKLNKATLVKFRKVVMSPAPQDVVEEFFDSIDHKTPSKPTSTKDEIITRLACLKAASNIAKSYEETIALAEKFVKWAKQ